MNKFLSLAILTIFLANFAYGQHSICNTPHILNNNISDKNRNVSELRSGETCIIRTVIHLVYEKDEENFSDSMVFSIINKLNDVFKGDIDTNYVHPQHRHLIHDSDIKFCLATTDPNGASTNGITRKQVDQRIPIYPNNLASMEEYGTQPWDAERYFNIWISAMDVYPGETANVGIPYSGFFPLATHFDLTGVNPGAYIDNNYWNFPFWGPEPIGVVAHEVGHALGLAHVWGPPASDECQGNDFMDDTPTCELTSVYFCDTEENTCEDDEEEIFDNVANIMNYSCQAMITPDQSNTIRANLALKPSLLKESCGSTVSVNDDIDELRFKIYPNPAQNHIVIVDKLGENEWFKISFYRITGELIKETEVWDTKQEIFYLDVLESGMYIITICNNSFRHSKKILISK